MRTEFWGVVVKPGESYREFLRARLHLTQATISFRDNYAQRHLEAHQVYMSVSERRVFCTSSSDEILLCTLGTLQTRDTVQHIPRVPLDIKIESGCLVTLTATAPIHLIGCWEID